MRRILTAIALSLSLAPSLLAQHDHGDGENKVKAPRIFLDKSPRIVEYQLKRLSNEQLLAVETQTDDAKYLPVFGAILTREGMSRAYREAALQGMVAINKSSAVAELAGALKGIKGDGPAESRTIKALAQMLLAQPKNDLSDENDQLQLLADSGNRLVSPVGYGAMLMSGDVEALWGKAKNDAEKQVAILDAVGLIPAAENRTALHGKAMDMLTSSKSNVQRAALRALAEIPANQSSTFQKAAELIENEELRVAVVKTLLSVPADQRNEKTSLGLTEWLVNFAENTEPAQRTENSFLDAMELVDQLLAKVPSDLAKPYRKRLSETVVRVVRIHTVEEEMRYDIPYFAVEAGRPVQVVLINDDLMPHNLVITKPGALKEVADEGLAVGPDGGMDGKQYVPHNDNVLFATNMIPTLESERLTFDAPTEPGEYPYVCTFPRHWMRMYGVMVVVDDLDAWSKNPVEPTDPIGSNRSFVQSWTVEDFKGQLEQGLRGRSPQIGERIFTEATCAQCHKIGGLGVGNVGPVLSKSFAKFKGDNAAVLQEILDPSHRIDDKYAVHLILDLDDRTYSGLVVSEDKEMVKLLENPEAKEPTTILKDDIETMVKTSNSMMPKGLMDRFSKDEIYELLSFLKGAQAAE